MVSAKHRALVFPKRDDVLNLVPSAKVFEFKSRTHIALPHDLQSTLLLRNVGLDAPAPILSQYEWPHPPKKPPFRVQRLTSALLTTAPRAYVLNDMGTGKTAAALWAYDFLRQSNMCQRMLVVAPLSTLDATWGRHVFEFLPHRKAVTLTGTRERRLRLLNDMSADIYVINHDGVQTIIDELRKRRDIDVLCIDELAVYRSARAKRSKAMRGYAATMKWVWGMTGRPAPKDPTDVWSQCKIVSPHTVPDRFTHFRDDLMRRHGPFLFLPKDDAVDKAFAVMRPSVRYVMDDVTELPPIVYENVDVPMGVAQRKTYDSFRQHALTQIADKQIDAMNAGAALNKLLQIACGWVYTRDQQIIPLDAQNRLQQLEDDLQSNNNKAIVFIPFVSALTGVVEHLRNQGFDTAMVYGGTPPSERAHIFNDFQSTAKYDVLCAHPVCMAHGITLTEANMICWFSPTPNLEVFEQANARIRRVGQTRRQLIRMYQGSPAERRMYSILRTRQRVQDQMLELFEATTSQ